MTGGYSEIARAVSGALGREVTRGQVWAWDRRRAQNAAGEPFPAPAGTDDAAPRTRPRRVFDASDVLAWLQGGRPVPGRHHVDKSVNGR
jgi:hypothetical protein